jgi:uncharacterized delta-60 repeat protein
MMKINTFATLIFVSFLLSVGCSQGVNSTVPALPGSLIEYPAQGSDDLMPLIDSDIQTTLGMMGGYSLTISPDSMTAELLPMRDSAIGESFIISGISFFDIFPCSDCFRISGLGYEDGRIIAKFRLKHPFPKGNTQEPPSVKNRLDLDVFDPALIVAPKPLSPIEYALQGMKIPEYIIDNPDGFTSELSNVLEESIALPYVLVIDDSGSDPPDQTFNRFAMGESREFEVLFPVVPGQILVFDLFLTFGYGASATLLDRLNPQYYNPEFNRKASWKVDVIPPNGSAAPAQGNTWDDTDNTTEYNVTVKVYDWQIGTNVNSNLTNPTDIFAASGIDSVRVEIPGMTNTIKQIDGNSFTEGTGMPDSPLVFTIPIANENLIPYGEYTGLVAVYDERSPLDISEGRDFLIHSPDGKNLVPHQILGYVTYQTFKATVAPAPTTTEKLIWAKRAGGSDDDWGTAITMLSDNSTVVTGEFRETATFGAGDPNETVLTSDGLWDMFIARYNSDGTLVWAKRAGGSDWDVGYGVTALSDDSMVIAGNFGYESSINASATFGPGESNETILTSDGKSDCFIARYNPDGTLAWAKRFGGPHLDASSTITKLSDNSTIVTGYFDSLATFGPGEPNQIVLNSTGWLDIFIARYNPDGTLAWAKHAGGSDGDFGNGITTLSDDSTVVTGRYSDAATFGMGEPNQITLNGSGFFIARFNPDGTLTWAKPAENAYSRAITTLSDNSLVVTGTFSAAAIFGQGEPNQTILNSSGEGDIFVARYNPDGTLSWAKRAGGSGDEFSSAITTLSDNSTMITGCFSEIATFGAGETNQTGLTTMGEWDVFVARYNPDGTLAWAKGAGGIDKDVGWGITSLSDDSAVATGYFNDTAIFGSREPNETALTSAGAAEMFIAHYAHN